MRTALVSGVAVLLGVLLSPASPAGQSPKATAIPSKTTTGVKSSVPRMPDGRPDLQGTWDFAQLTPLERPGAFKDKDAITEEEAEEVAQQRIETSNKDRRDGGAAADVERAYNDFWWDFGTRVAKQPSLVVDPPTGRIPDTTQAAKDRAAARRGKFDNPEERPLPERCILGFNSGPPMIPSAYNNNVQIVQSGDRVMIHNEMIHSARIVDLSRTKHLPASLRFLTGDSIGRWEVRGTGAPGKNEETLVVDTTNFRIDGAFRGATRNMHLVERFTRVDRDLLRYEFTIDDPETWARPWSASIPMVRTEQPMFEYACHEGNYALEGVLKGARFQEKQTSTSKR